MDRSYGRSLEAFPCSPPAPYERRFVLNLTMTRCQAPRHLHLHLVIQPFLHERPPQRRIHADVAGCGIELVRPHDAVAREHALVVLHRHPRAEEHTARVRWRPLDDDHSVQPLAQESHAPVDLAEPALAVDIFRVLRAIALRRGLRHRLRDARALYFPQLVQLPVEPARAFRRDVFRARFLRLTVASHEVASSTLCLKRVYKKNGGDLWSVSR
jgi:hypothetical protein